MDSSPLAAARSTIATAAFTRFLDCKVPSGLPRFLVFVVASGETAGGCEVGAGVCAALTAASAARAWSMRPSRAASSAVASETYPLCSIVATAFSHWSADRGL